MKKTLINTVLTTTLLAATSAAAEVVVVPETGVEIMAVNGVAIESDSFFSNTARLELENGKHQVVVEYLAEIEDSADDFLLERSDTFVLLFEAKDVQLNIAAPQIDSHYDLKAFNRDPQWQLKTAAGQTVAYQVDTLEKEGFQLGRDYAEELQRFNQTAAKAALPSLTHATHSFATEVAPATAADIQSTDQKMAGEMLQFWYERADENTRDKFKSWIKTSH
ncbi:YccT family protein [Marinobacterium weihaiense]|uniref:UPF0319 protein KTN04_05860 n=1 Tax=Marinobacterium weihaiense TaxID=2851016 RepID=A0ABS6MAG0_9GAMM|nr:DUF2057 domain-containing protein [Marinobacterium weihaiense]MBV0932861.1 DUF2057 domain-containing protein [Marinobacterium weihaiense]